MCPRLMGVKYKNLKNCIILLLSYTSVKILIYIQWNCHKPRNCDAYALLPRLHMTYYKTDTRIVCCLTLYDKINLAYIMSRQNTAN